MIATRGLVAGLRGPVGRSALQPHSAQARGHADDPAPSLRPQVSHHRPGHEERTAEIHRDRPAPCFGRVVPEVGPVGWGEPGPPGIDAGVVEQDMHASQLRDGRADRPLHGLGVGDVGDDRDGDLVTAQLPHLVDALVEPFLVDIQQRHPSAGTHEAQGDSVADADRASGPGDDGDFALKRSLDHFAPPCVRLPAHPDGRMKAAGGSDRSRSLAPPRSFGERSFAGMGLLPSDRLRDELISPLTSNDLLHLKTR